MLNINTVVLDEIAKNISQQINNDTRFFFERAGKKRPKIDSLKYLIPSIIELMILLFPFREQLKILNRTNKKFAVSDTTYYSFLQEFLPNEYMRFKKNTYFSGRISKIKEVLNMGLSYEQQFKFLDFSGKLNGDTVLDLKVEDYSYFIENYYNKDMNEFYKKIDYHSRTHIKSELNPDFFKKNPIEGVIESHIDTLVKETTLEDALNSKVLLEAINIPKKVQEDVFKNVKEEIQEVSKSVEVEKPQIVEYETCEGYKIIEKGDFKYKLYNTLEDRKVLANERGLYQLDIYDDVELGVEKKRFDIVRDFEDLPKELARDKNFIYADIDLYKKTVNEDFVYLFDVRLFHYLNPDSYGLVNGLLFVVDGAYEYESFSGQKCYRFFNGTLYYIEKMTVGSGFNGLLQDQLVNYGNNNGTRRMVQWRRKYYDYLSEEIDKLKENNNNE